ncbi:hypothetical protein, conserved [Eimeria maxima]|uniref:Uncharacterized protein n=1 Tax=Eimeria maxima TaxID=5804 RepID=U6MCF5_EIMMA|nr:hypothetical protein, conserved [Eimeria maxima]CDJ60743.1 hypothetical protein, conserved [Eimeria maxima]
MGNRCVGRRAYLAKDSMGTVEGQAEVEKRQNERLQKLETARHEALRTLKTSQALTKAETTRKIKIQKAREQLGIKPFDDRSEESSESEM